MELFDYVVLENGGVLYAPPERQTTVLCPPASMDLLENSSNAESSRSSGGRQSW